MDLEKLIREYLAETKLVQIATSKSDQPWVCNVYFAYDDKLNLYWISLPDRRHSQEIKANSKVAAAIVKPHTPGDDVRGLQIEGVGKELAEKEMEDGLRLYATRYNMPEVRVKEILNDTDGHMVYQLKPTTIVLFDEVNFPDSPRQELHLK